jgi:hypothetical protein
MFKLTGTHDRVIAEDADIDFLYQAVVELEIEEHIQKLASDSIKDRLEAQMQLITLGPKTIPQLTRALGNDDIEIRWAAAELIEILSTAPEGNLLSISAESIEMAA